MRCIAILPSTESLETKRLTSDRTPWCFELSLSGTARVGVRFFGSSTIGELLYPFDSGEVPAGIQNSQIIGLYVFRDGGMVSLYPNSPGEEFQVHYFADDGTIEEMEYYYPTDETEPMIETLQSSVGVARYVNPFMLNIADTYAPSHSLVFEDAYSGDFSPFFVIDAEGSVVNTFSAYTRISNGGNYFI